MRRTGGPTFGDGVEPDPDETVTINTDPEPIILEDGTPASDTDKKIGTILAAIFAGVIIVVFVSCALWVVVNMWKDILS